MEILEIGIVGILASGLIQLIKNTFGAGSMKAKMITIGVSLVAGGAIYFFSGTPQWMAFLGVLATASTVYAFIIK